MTAERFLSYYDYSERNQTFFEIGIYVVNMFETRDTKSLIDSIELAKLEEIPNKIQGAGHCLDIFDRESLKRFPICLKDEKTLNQITEVFEEFYRCRMGIDMRNNYDKIKKICNESKKPKESINKLFLV